MNYDAFISYRRNGGFLMAQILRSALKERGINCFLDLEEERQGKFDERLLDAINKAQNYIIVLTKDALDRCVNKDDWVRKEIVAAVTANKNIIPVRYYDFVWPKHLNKNFPEEIRRLETVQSVLLSQEYLSSSIERVMQYMVSINRRNIIENHEVSSDTADFFLKGFTRIDSVKSIDISFRAGSEWHYKSNLVDILLRIIELKIKLRVLINEEKTVAFLSMHMRQPLKKYYGYTNSLNDWLNKARDFPDIISVRIADVPLMHRYYCINGDSAGTAKISYYTYGNYNPEKDPQFIFNKDENEYRLYSEEFNYLWQHASREIV